MLSRGSSRVFSVDPDRPTVPTGLQAPSDGRGQVVALLADDATREAGWVGSFAIDLAEAWASGEAGVILADGDLTTSLLHELVGTPNVEGVSDVVRYGASTDRVARPVGSRSFRFIPKGTIVPDPDGVYAERRWSDWFSQVRDAGTVLVLCLPSGVDGVAALSEGADRILVLTGDDVAAPDDERVVIVRAERILVEDQDPAAARDAASAENPGGVERLVTAPAASRRKGGARGTQTGPGKILLLAFLVVILLLIVASWLGLVSIPGLTGSVSTG